MRSVSTLALLSMVSALAACAPEGSSAYVSFNIPPDSTCLYSPTVNLFVSAGQYDIGNGTIAPNCRHSYFMHLLVNSNLKANARAATGRAEPNVLQIMDADVRLMDKNQSTLSFTCGANNSKCGGPDDVDPTVPNPFRVQTGNSLPPTSTTDPSTGVVAIEAIPQAYGPHLVPYADDKVLVEVTIFGTTTGDVDIDFRPFVFPVAICRGCLSICMGSIPEGTTPTDLRGTGCADNAAQDGRYCIDPTCGFAK